MSHSDTQRALVLFAPGAGASTASDFIQEYRQRLEAFCEVVCFDYPYQRAGRRSPDRHPVLLEAHRQAFSAARASRPNAPIFLLGKSMGGRIGCHLAVELGGGGPVGLVCLGYPLIGRSGARRDQVLRELSTPVLFVQGTRDALCPLEELAQVRAQMRAPNELHVVDGADHSLHVGQRALRANDTTQDRINSEISNIIHGFLARKAGAYSGNIPAQLPKNSRG